MKRTLLLSSALLLCTATLFAQPVFVEKTTVEAGKAGIPYEKYKLPNGLTILLHEDHSDPIVNVSVLYKVGSNREDLGRSGFAHFFEHMMFQGSKHVADEEHFKTIQSAGGNMNGFTERDRTVYYETLPSNYLELALWLEADRMGFLLDSLYAKKFENQRDAVKNEKSQNVENQPYALGFVEEINKILYPPQHPYSWPTIGYVDELNAATLEDVKNFFLRWYGPNNAILTVSGDFNKDEALKWIDKYYGTLKPCPEVKKLRAAPVVIPQDKYGIYKDKVFLPLNLRVYPTVARYHRDEPALDLLGDMLGSGKNSLLYKNFVKNEKAVEAAASHGGQELVGEFQIYVVAYPPDDLNYESLFYDLDVSVKATLDEFEKSGITDEALARAKSKKESDLYGNLDGIFSKSLMIAQWEQLMGKPYTLQEEVDRYNKVTKEDLIRVFNKYIKGSGAAILNTFPILNPKDSAKSVNPFAGQKFPANPEYAGLKYEVNPDNFDRSKRPEPGPSKTVKVPDTYRFAMANGIKAIGTKFTETPFVNISIDMEGGELVHQDMKKMGLANITAGMLDESTKNYTPELIEAELDKLGSTINISAGKNNTSISVSSLKKNLDATLKLLEEKLFNPAFKEEDFKLLKKRMKADMKQQERQPDVMAGKAFDYVLYGETMMGTPSSIKSVDKITLQDVKDYYNKYYTPSTCNISIVGDLDEAEAKQKLEGLGKWAAKQITLPPPPVPQPAQQEQFFIYDVSGAPSSVINMGYPSLKFEAYGDFFKNRVANFVFGGNFNSRLNLNLREDKGYTYGIRSSFWGDKNTGRFVISSSVKRKATALSLSEINKELKGYVENGITDKELDFTKKSMLNQEAIKYESSFQKLGFLSTIITYGLENDYTAKQNEILRAMTKEDVNAQIKKHITPDKMNTVIVGDKVAIEAQLKKYNMDNVKLKKVTID